MNFIFKYFRTTDHIVAKLAPYVNQLQQHADVASARAAKQEARAAKANDKRARHTRESDNAVTVAKKLSAVVGSK